MNIIDVRPNETFEQYRTRIYRAKKCGVINLTWQQVTDLFNEKFGIRRCDRTWRNECSELNLDDNIYETEYEESESEEDVKLKNGLSELILEFKKERVKLSDERTQNNAYIRRLAREDTIIEIAKHTAETMSSKKLLKSFVHPSNINLRNNEAIVQLSDWHYGIEIDNFVNKFDPQMCSNRVSKLLEECESYFRRNPVKKIYVVNLGDLICGRIHTTLRIESRIDVITQCMYVSEILAEFLSVLSKIAPVDYYDCLDNHSRIEPNKKDSLDLESLARIIPWHLKFRFKDDDNINVRYNDFGDDIIAFSVMDGKWSIGGVHGHKDKPIKVIDNLTMLTKVNFDMILTAHLHHFNAHEKNEVLVVSNGSLMGTDQYAFDLRLSSKPSQNIILVSDKTPMEDLHRVVLD